MEQAISSLAFKGSIPQAITEAKHQKKLFVVYISGDNSETNHLEESALIDPRVAEILSNYCIFLHIPEGSTEAANFSAIYPQKHAPCITAIGYNGVQVWQSEGFVAADVLASSLQKAWLSLHIQETTASFLTAALASKKEPASGTSDTDTFEHGSSSSGNVPAPLINGQNQLSAAAHSRDSGIIEQNKGHLTVEEGNTSSATNVEVEKTGISESTTTVEAGSTSPDSVEPVSTKKKQKKLSDEHPIAKEKSDFDDNGCQSDKEASGDISYQVSKDVNLDSAHTVNEDKPSDPDSSHKSSDAHLNIRLPNGSSLQVKYSLNDTLRMVRDYVDGSQVNSFGSYDLAIPYPRKVFGDEDMDKTLSELGFFNRQALILVLHRQADSHRQGKTTSHIGSSSGSNEGYFGLIRRMISYINPFSYIGESAGSSNTTGESRNSMQQYSPNATVQNNIRADRFYASGPSDQNTHTANRSSGSKNRQQSSSHFGSNIHTLKHDEDDDRFSGRNAFWNGNSTQYGGDNDGK